MGFPAVYGVPTSATRWSRALSRRPEGVRGARQVRKPAATAHASVSSCHGAAELRFRCRRQAVLTGCPKSGSRCTSQRKAFGGSCELKQSEPHVSYGLTEINRPCGEFGRY